MANTTWKQVVLNTANALRIALGTTEKIKIKEIPTKVQSLENVTPEVDAQEPLLTELSAILEFKGCIISEDVTEEVETYTNLVNELDNALEGDKVLG